MLRTYVLILLVVGIGASFLSRGGGGSEPAHVLVAGGAVPAHAVSSDQPVSEQKIEALDRGIELTRDSSGYFYADVQVNGAPVHMLVDTGATIIALSRDDARMAGIATSIAMSDVVGRGADGAVKGEPVTLESVTLGDKRVENLRAVVLNSGGQSLLGQSFLSKFSSVHIEGDKMVLR